MIYHFAVKSIEIREAEGAFAEWCNASEEQDEADIERWQEAYFQAIVDAVKEYYPGAKVSIEETRETPKNFIEYKLLKEETPDTIDIDSWSRTGAELEADDQVNRVTMDVFDTVGNAGTFWAA
jgi:hypothetical protein